MTENTCTSYHSNQSKSTQQALLETGFQQGHLGQREKVGMLNSGGKVNILGKGIPNKCLSKTQEAENRRKCSGSDKNPGNVNECSQRQCWKGREGPRVASPTARSCLECRGEPRQVHEQSCVLEAALGPHCEARMHS